MTTSPPTLRPRLGTEDVEVVRSSRARRVSVRVDRVTGTVRVTLPQRAAEAEVGRALTRHQRWIAARLAEAAATQATVAARGNTIEVWGTPLTLVADATRQRVRRDGDRLLVPAGRDDLLERWLRGRARDELTPRTEAAAAALHLAAPKMRPLTRVSIGDARTRWGSCSARGTITYSWRLVLAPPWVAEAIVWHESCHLVHLDHSARFWNLLGQHEPRTDEARRWLRTHGATLQLPSVHASAPPI